jgi:hypothetical protein
MLSLTLESLVPHGVSVRKGGVALALRLGTSVKAGPQAPEVRTSLRPRWCGRQAFAPAGGPADVGNPGVDGVTPGAGRSRRLAGVPSRRSTARTAGRAIPLGWPLTHGGQAAAAKDSRRMTAWPVASVGEAPSRRLPAVPGALLGRCYQRPGKRFPTARPDRCKPAGRTPPASTWGTAVR